MVIGIPFPSQDHLERLLMQFTGAVILVTHDRYFLDKVATALLAFEGQGKVVRHEGNYDLYRRLSAQSKKGAAAPTLPGGLVGASPPKNKQKQPR